jgi:hypothetical protein
MIERLQRALAHIDELPPEVQEELVTLIEERTEPEHGSAVNDGSEAEVADEAMEQGTHVSASLAGAWSDLLYDNAFADNAFAAFERMRHEVPPSLPLDLDDGA